MTQRLPCFPAASLRSYAEADTSQIIVIANELAARPKIPLKGRDGAAIPAPSLAPTLPKLSPTPGRSKQERSKQGRIKQGRSKRGRNGR